MDCGVVAKRAVVGVMAVIVGAAAWEEAPTARCLLGVIAMGTGAAEDPEGVRPRRSKRPKTRPSFCGVGLMEVGTAAAGVRDARSADGVAA